MPQAKNNMPNNKLKLEPGKFYLSKDNYVWCCFYVCLSKQEHAQANCIRIDDERIEYFYLDGRYDAGGKREHNLVKETEFKYDD